MQGSVEDEVPTPPPPIPQDAKCLLHGNLKHNSNPTPTKMERRHQKKIKEIQNQHNQAMETIERIETKLKIKKDQQVCNCEKPNIDKRKQTIQMKQDTLEETNTKMTEIQPNQENEENCTKWNKFTNKFYKNWPIQMQKSNILMVLSTIALILNIHTTCTFMQVGMQQSTIEQILSQIFYNIGGTRSTHD